MEQKLEFPKGFYWGAASASYQVEGNIYNTDWAYEARTSQRVPVADSGPDHWNRYKEDFEIAKSLGHNATRISIEWARIEPAEGEYDIEAIRHYENVLREIKKQGMEPFITLWHFTIPEWLYKKGGAENECFPAYFEKYAKYTMKHLHKYCSHWVTMNEPEVFTSNGWMRGNWPPFKHKFFLEMKVTNNLAKAHKLAYLAMKNIDLNSEVGIVKDNIWFHANRNLFNKFAAKVMQKYWNFRFLNKIKNHYDSIGLNYYFHKPFGNKKHYKKNDMGWDIFPEGIFHVLLELKRFKKPIFIAEAGIADRDDVYRGQYIKDLVYWVHRAILEEVPIKGFMYWSLTDNFEWAKGYDQRFGLIEIDYETKKRKVRDSAYEYKKICESNSLLIK